MVRLWSGLVSLRSGLVSPLVERWGERWFKRWSHLGERWFKRWCHLGERWFKRCLIWERGGLRGVSSGREVV